MIILEGPDCSGKSSLARAVFDEHPYKHHGLYDEKQDPMYQTIDETYHGVNDLWDRLHIGEQVYGPIYRGVDRLGAAGRRMLERFLLSRQAVLVKCIPPWQNVFLRFEERQAEEMFNEEKYPQWQSQLHEQWLQFQTAKSWLPTVWWNYVTDDPVQLRTLAYQLMPGYNYGPGAGEFRQGNILIVGEKISDKDEYQQVKRVGPFIMRGGCSEWLAEQMDEVGVPEQGLYWINALDNHERPTPAYPWIDDLQPRLVVALGGVAKMWCQVNQLKNIEHFPHPQWWKRFKHHQRYPLVDLLKKENCELAS